MALAGMAGSDEVVFEGANMLTRGGTTVPESLLFYGGTVQDHKKVKLYTLLPDKSTIQKTAAGGVKDLKSNAYAMKPYYSQLEKKEGRWELQTTENSSEEGNPLPALNPLKQLEELESMEKSVTEEAGAGRGTSVLRIELTPSEARKQLSAELEKEMQNLRPKVSESAENNAEADQAVTEALEKLWQKKNNELQQKLKQANVETVYHLTVDKKHNLPRRLTLNRKVSYSGEMMNKSENETYVSKVDFTGYR
ncbi:hypothetical protein [Paenibacillus sp. PastF-3]|uniref:hypothetical protein n=1 Tax=Paenibacillus sp. PastF-3 TaxID=2940626 RepID=UPI002473DB2E|nr:hypothetical protein [Paenibacillus sp. PastF-3]